VSKTLNRREKPTIFKKSKRPKCKTNFCWSSSSCSGDDWLHLVENAQYARLTHAMTRRRRRWWWWWIGLVAGPIY